MTPYMTGKMRTLLATAAAGLALAGCEAGATDKKIPEKAEFTKLAAVVETTKVTMAECVALMPDEDKTKACVAKLEAQQDAEIAAKKNTLANLKQKEEVLTRLNEVAREEFEKEARPQN